MALPLEDLTVMKDLLPFIPAICSAVAASFAALCSYQILRTQKYNLIESIRPELIITDWERGADGEPLILRFGTVKNVGRGCAHHVRIDCQEMYNGYPVASMGTETLPLLPNGESSTVDGTIMLWRSNSDNPPEGVGRICLSIVLICWDNHGNRYRTTYTVYVMFGDMHVLGAAVVAPGVWLLKRSSSYKNGSWLAVRSSVETRALKLKRRVLRLVDRVVRRKSVGNHT